MSNPPFGQKSDGQRTNHLQSEPIPFSLASPHQLAQFSAAAATGYYPKPQSNASGFSAGTSANKTDSFQQSKTTTSTTTTTTNTKPMSDFAKSAYDLAKEGANGLQPPPSQPIDLKVCKGLKFVTLDGLQVETREIYDEISGTFQWEMCESQDDRCNKFIREECVDKRVFLISSGSLGRKLVPLIHDLPQVYAIYIYCGDVEGNQKWANSHSKIRVVCNDDDKYLLPQLAVDVAQANIELGDAFVKDGKRDKAKEKYQKALQNLEKYPEKVDPRMVTKVKSKLEECK